MKCIILAAGYATRLYPLTKDKPKPLLEVKGRPIIEHILDKLNDIDLEEIFIVTNEKFFSHFLEWRAGYNHNENITIVNDKTGSNEDRLGSLGDIRYVVENLNVDDDLMVIAGDNIFEFGLLPVVQMYHEKHSPVVVLYDVNDFDLAKQYGIVSIDDKGKIVGFQEKPKNPQSTLSSTGIYLYPKQTVRDLIRFSEENDADKAGNFLEYLYKKTSVYCFVTEKKWFDIGTLDQLKKAQEEFSL